MNEALLAVPQGVGRRAVLRLVAANATHDCLLAANAQPVDELEARLDPWLGADERLRLGRAAHPRRRVSFLRGRAAAKDALAGLCGDRHAASCFEIVPGAFEQPVVLGPEPNLGVSLSHTDSVAIAAAFPETHPLGVDVERIDPANETVLREYVASRELPGVSGIDALTLQWAVREALSKVLRGGLAVDFSMLALDAPQCGEDGILRVGFAHFAHLRAEAIAAHGHVFALVMPARWRAEWDVRTVRAWLGVAADGAKG